MRSRIILLGLVWWILSGAVAHARPLTLQWTMEAPLPWTHTGFIIQSCTPSPRGVCTMKDAGGVAAWQHQILVTVPNNPTQQKCFHVQTVRGVERSAASERLCVLPDKE